MTGVRTFEVDDCAGNVLAEAKAGRTVSVCIPCRDEAATIGPLVSVIRRELMGRNNIVDELIVLDDRSTDDTARVAAHAGARVVSIDDVHATHGWGHGKGNALWATLLVSHGDFIVWCDGDVTSFEPDWVVKLLSPMLDDESVALVKALYHRPTPLRRRRTDNRAGRATADVDVLPRTHRPARSRCRASTPGAVTCWSDWCSNRAGASRSRC